METIKFLFGTGENLNSLQMGCRAFIIFFIALILVRISGMRTFGKQSAVDIIISFMLGAILSRAVTGASPFIPVIIASVIIVVTHRVIAFAAVYNELLGKIVKGEERVLYRDGKIIWKNMKRSSISYNDLLESVRLETNKNSLDIVKEAHIESNGRISVITKE